MSALLNMWNKVSSKPGGKWLFTRGVCLKAPYFGTIKPMFQELSADKAVVTFRERRAVHNHIKTVHAIAMCNSAELAGGLLCDVATPKGMRWIPKGMTVEYKNIAKGKLTATATIEKIEVGEAREVITPVSVTNEAGVEVFRAEIKMWVSPSKKKAA